MWRTIAVVLGAAVLVVAGAVAGSALAAPAGGGTVYIATGENFPDAVTAGAAGGADAGPVLLVRQNSIPTVTLDELNRLQPFKIVIVGGTGVISPGVEDQLKGLSFGPVVVRRGGADRYETAALVAQVAFPKTGAASCPASGFFPSTSGIAHLGTLSRWATGSFPTSFNCELSLPHRATITRLWAGLDDTDSLEDTFCNLRRVDITGGSFSLGIGSSNKLAETFDTTGNPGPVRMSTTTIDHPLVNNARYGYWITCLTNQDMKIIGATVEYELTG